MDVAGGIHRIDTDFYGRVNSLFLLVGANKTMLIDTGVGSTPGEYLVPYLRDHAIDAPIDYVLNTHADLDHVGGNAAVAELFPDSAQICHALDQEWIDNTDALIEERYDEYAALGIGETVETKAFLKDITGAKATDTLVTGGEKFSLSDDWQVEILHTPGHSFGHIAVWDQRSSTLFIGDAVLSDGLYMADGSPAFPPTYRYVDDYVATIDKLAALNAEVLLCSHYPTMQGDEVAAFFDGSSAYVDRVEQAVSSVLGSSDEPMSLRSIIAATSPELGPWGEDAALSLKFPILGHLERMIARGEVERVVVDGTPCFARLANG
jgi:glyoxylase-like metal-dependent hydrolase (beta-lactamase superfamily II)